MNIAGAVLHITTVSSLPHPSPAGNNSCSRNGNKNMWLYLSHSSSQLCVFTLEQLKFALRLEYEVQQLGNEHTFDSNLSLPAMVAATSGKGEGRTDGTSNDLNYHSCLLLCTEVDPSASVSLSVCKMRR